MDFRFSVRTYSYQDLKPEDCNSMKYWNNEVVNILLNHFIGFCIVLIYQKINFIKNKVYSYVNLNTEYMGDIYVQNICIRNFEI